MREVQSESKVPISRARSLVRAIDLLFSELPENEWDPQHRQSLQDTREYAESWLGGSIPGDFEPHLGLSREDLLEGAVDATKHLNEQEILPTPQRVMNALKEGWSYTEEEALRAISLPDYLDAMKTAFAEYGQESPFEEFRKP